jgi:hypothetical protein
MLKDDPQARRLGGVCERRGNAVAVVAALLEAFVFRRMRQETRALKKVRFAAGKRNRKGLRCIRVPNPRG